MERLKKRYWTNKDGSQNWSWEFRYTDKNGHEKKKSFGKEKPTAKQLSNLTETISDNPTFKEFAENWLSTIKSVKIKKSTMETYQNYLKNNLRLLWTKKIKSITDKDIALVINFLYDEGKAEKTVKNIKEFISSIFRYALYEGLVLKNPTTFIELKKVPKGKMKALYGTEIKSFEEIIKKEPKYIHVLLKVLLHTGMRISEAIALTWNDVDFQSNMIDINKQWYRQRLTSVKNYEERTIEIGEVLKPILQEYKEETQRNGNDLIFSIVSGKHINSNNVREHYFRRIMKELSKAIGKDFTAFSPHCLRHTHATYLLANGVDVIVVSKRLGHKDINITLSVYRHVIPKDKQVLLSALKTL